MQPRLLEIQNEEQELRRIMAEAVMRLNALAEERQAISIKTVFRRRQTLTFDPGGKTIRWEGGSVTLGRKSCHFVKTLWFAKKRRMKTCKLCEKVFGCSTTPDETLRKFIQRLSNALYLAKFPYEIKPVKIHKPMKTKGLDWVGHFGTKRQMSHSSKTIFGKTSRTPRILSHVGAFSQQK